MSGRAEVTPDTRELVRQAVERLGAPAPARRGTSDGAIYVRCPYVLTDYFGVIAGPEEWLAGQARIVGHTSALAETGTLAAPELLRSVEPTADLGYRAACDLLDLPRRPTALVAFNDKTAVGALRAAAERGLRVPQDLSIAGFDDSELSRSTTPTLTTVRQPLEEMGRMAVSLLMRTLERHTVDTLHIELATRLVVRDSTGPAS